MRRLTWFMLAILLLAIGGGWYSFGKGMVVKAVPVTQADLVQSFQATGKVKAKHEHKVFAQTSGKLQHVYVKAGDTVKEQQVLAEMDLSDTRIKLSQLEQQLIQVQADWNKLQEGPKPEEVKLLEENVRQEEIKLELTTRDWNRLRNDYDAGTALKAALQQKEDEMKLAESALSAARNQLALSRRGPSASDEAKYNAKLNEIRLGMEQLENELSNMRIVSGRNGTITDLFIQEGQSVEAGMELLNLADLSELEIVSDVKETLISQVFGNQEAVIEGSALGKERLAARVTRIAAVAKASSQANQDKRAVVAVTLTLENQSGKLLPGYNVDVNFVSNRVLSALQVPGGAIKRDGDGTSYVWSVREGRAVRVPVETGIKNETFVEITKGLEADSLVIMNVPDTLKDRQKVILIP